MPQSWQDRLSAASSEAEVIQAARDFAAQFTHFELASLPEDCRPGKLRDAQDVTEYAFALVRHRCDDGEGATYTVHRLTNFFSNASLRLSQILHSHPRQEAVEAQSSA